MANDRIHYPIQQVAFRKPGTTVFREAHGVQSVAMTTTFNLTQAFELSQLAIYENIEGIPDIEVTMTKLLDGYPLLFCLATASDAAGASYVNPDLAGRAGAETILQLGIWDESFSSVQGSPDTYVEMSGMTVSSLTYNFPLEDNFTEDITLVGNRRIWDTYSATGTCPTPWSLTAASAASGFLNNDDAPVGSGGVNRRENMIFATDATTASNADYTVLPADIFGVNSDGSKTSSVHVASITVSADLTREDLFELGKRSPYKRALQFPIEVTCDIEVTSVSGDQVNAIDDCGGSTAPCTSSSNLQDRKIRIATCEGTRIYLGTKNKLASVTYGGGDAGGGNVTTTYSYTTFNDLTVLHSGDDFNSSGLGWWNDRKSYLGATTQGI